MPTLNTLLDHCDHDPNDVDEQILRVLNQYGARSVRAIDSEIDSDCSRSWINKRLTRLADDGPVAKVDRGLYELEDLSIDADTASQPVEQPTDRTTDYGGNL